MRLTSIYFTNIDEKDLDFVTINDKKVLKLVNFSSST